MRREATPFELQCLIVLNKINNNPKKSLELTHEFLWRHNVEFLRGITYEGNVQVHKTSATLEA